MVSSPRAIYGGKATLSFSVMLKTAATLLLIYWFWIYRIQLALQERRVYLSLVSDGMAQTHCSLPWLGNKAQIPNLKHHIQGIYAHGRTAYFYRHFHNINNTANVQIHTLLLTLENLLKDVKEKDNMNQLPPTLFFQVDGGSENVAKVVFFVCELLVATGVLKKIVLSRLMVGHTHCDIDALFGRIWVYCRVIFSFRPKV